MPASCITSYPRFTHSASALTFGSNRQHRTMNRKRKPRVVILAASLFMGGCATQIPQPPRDYHQAQRASAAPAVAVPQRVGIIRSSIVGDFEGFDYGNVYELANGRFWEQTDVWIWMGIAVQPRVTIITDGVVGKMEVEGIDHAVGVRLIDSAILQSYLASDFDGFDLGKIYELDNGEVWQQTQALIRVRVMTHPKVLIWKSGASYKMKVGDISESVGVKRIK